MKSISFHLGLLAGCFLTLVGSQVWAQTTNANGEPSRDGVVQRFTVQGEFRPSHESARDSALRTAQEQIREWLATQDPPIRKGPSLETIRREMNVRELKPQVEQILNSKDKMYKVTLEVELRPKHLRDLRENERVISAVWSLGGILFVLGIIVLGFRIDEWTKGYLTRWLFVAGVGSVLAIAAVWWFGR